MYTIKDIDYHYYYELTTELDIQLQNGFRLIQIIDMIPSGDNKKMHRAVCLFILDK